MLGGRPSPADSERWGSGPYGDSGRGRLGLAGWPQGDIPLEGTQPSHPQER